MLFIGLKYHDNHLISLLILLQPLQKYIEKIFFFKSKFYLKDNVLSFILSSGDQ